MKKNILIIIFFIIMFSICNISFSYATEDNDELIKDSLIVKTDEIETIKNDYDNIENVIEVANDLYIIEYDNENNADESFELLDKDDKVEKVLKDIPVSIFSDDVEEYSVNVNEIAWGVNSTGMDHYTDYLNYKDKDTVLVAVLDTGINKNHEVFTDKTFADRICLDYAYNYILGSTNVTDNQGHGTMVSSIIVESTPSNVKIVPIKVLSSAGNGSFINIVAALSAIKDKVDIINMSFGIEQNKIIENGFDIDWIEEVLEEIYDDGNGPLMVCASGNGSHSDDVPGWAPVSYPACSEYTIAVSALTQNGNDLVCAEYSDIGSSIDFSAPGTNIEVPYYLSTNEYVLCSGTSAATPFVSAALSLIKSEHSSYTPNELVDELKNNVEDLGTAGKDSYYGYGSINFCINKFEKPVIARLRKDATSTNCTITINAVCDDSIKFFTYKQYSQGVNDSDWRNISNPSRNLETSITITKNGKYTLYLKDIEGDVGKVSFNVTEIEEQQQEEIAVSSIKLNQNSLELNRGESVSLLATVNPLNATNNTITWKSSNTSIATVNSNGVVTGTGIGNTIITAQAGEKTATCLVTVNGKTPSVKYRTHIQSVGWQAYVYDGALSGTTGKSLRLEGINICLDSPDITGGIEYRTHVQKIGWQDYVSNGALSGTSGKALRLEAIQIRLTGNISEQYDIYYRVHSQSFGWLGWAKNGEQSGTSGYGYRLEGIQIRIVKKGDSAPGSTENCFYKAVPTVSYKSFVQDNGWQAYVSNGVTSGTVGNGLRLEAIKIKLNYLNTTGGIEYSSHIQKKGWTDYVSNDEISGTTDQGLRLEAIRIRLTGEIADTYDIYYRVHCQKIGWLGWAMNGESAGTTGLSYRIEGIQIQLVKKGESAPGSTTNRFRSK